MATEFYLFSAFTSQGGTDADLPSLENEVRAVGGGLQTKFDYSEKTPAGAPMPCQLVKIQAKSRTGNRHDFSENCIPIYCYHSY